MSRGNLSLVTKSNAFIRAHVKTDSKAFYHILNIVASKIQPSDTDFQVYDIPVREILRSSPDAGVGGQRYKAAAEIIKKVMTSVLYLPKENQKLSVYTLFSKIELDENNHSISVGIHPDLKPHFLELNAHYTRIKLNYLLAISSKYSIRLYEILMSWKSMSIYEARLSDLHDMLGTPSSMRKDFRQFRTRILVPAQRDIYSKADFWFTWEPVKVGRRVDGLVFSLLQPDSAKLKKMEIDRIAKLQKESNQCFEKNQIKGEDCKPKKRNEACQYCMERGRRYLQMFKTEQGAN